MEGLEEERGRWVMVDKSGNKIRRAIGNLSTW